MRIASFIVLLLTFCLTATAQSADLQSNITRWFQHVTETGLNSWNQIELALHDNELSVYYSGYYNGTSPEALRVSTVSANMCPLLVRHYFDRPAPAGTTIVASQRNDVAVSRRSLPEIDFGAFDVSALNFQVHNSRTK